MKYAYIRWYGRKSGNNERRAALRSGKKGRGKVIQVVHYLANSPLSMDNASDIFHEVADREGYTIVGSDRDQP